MKEEMKEKEITKKVKAKETKFTKKLRKNPYIAITFALGLLCLIMIVGGLLEDKNIVQTEDEILCSRISATPAWVDIEGKILGYGFQAPENSSVDMVNQVLIPNKIKLIYSSKCGACEMQINYFKGQGTWEVYQSENLTINCDDV